MITIDRSLDTIDQLNTSPGFESAVGTSSILPTIPGTEKADFEAVLEKFQGQQFLTGVQQMRGLGTLTETEGKKITQAAAALSPSMSEKAFKKEMKIIENTLRNAKKREQRKLKGFGGKQTEEPLSDESKAIKWDDLK